MDPRILAIETTTNTCSVAVYMDGRVQIEHSLRKPRAHAEQLVPMIQRVLTYAQLPVQSLDAIAVSGGPGSYTGLRIGVSTAKGLAFAYAIKMVSVPSLSAMAYSSLPFVGEKESILVSRNSRKGELYVASFEKTGTHTFIEHSPPDAVLLADLESKLPDTVLNSSKLWLSGEGSLLAKDHLSERITEQCQVLPASSVSPSAGSIAHLGAISFAEGSFVDVSKYEPVYLKDFIPKLRKTSVFDRLPF